MASVVVAAVSTRHLGYGPMSLHGARPAAKRAASEAQAQAQAQK